MNSTPAPIPADQHNGNDYDPEIPTLSRGPYNYDDLELSIICEGWSLSDPPDTDSDSASHDPRDVEDLWCYKCFTGFRTPEALLQHRRTSTLHIACGVCEIAEDFANPVEHWQHCCDRHFGCPYCKGATVWSSAAGLDKHCQIDHLPCRVCISVQYFATRDDLHGHYRLEHWSCGFCNYQSVFTSREGLLAHRRTAHGFFDCEFCYPQQPEIIWPTSCREHMEQCPYPDVCNNDLDPIGFRMLSYCGACRKTLTYEDRYHFTILHYCGYCIRCDSIFKMCRLDHLDKCWHQRLQKLKELGIAHSMRAGGPFQPEDPQPGNVHEKWQERQQQQQRNQEGEPNESARESSQRKQEDFDARANEQSAPPPSQEPQEPAPLDLYTVLNISPESSQDDIKRAVRVRRVETHPDKRKRQGSSKGEEDTIDEEAKLVGWAADIVLDPEKRQRHDQQMRAWKVRYGQ